MSAEPVADAVHDGLDATLGLQVDRLDPEVAEGWFEVGPRHRQRFGIVHGGTYAAIAEFLASEGTLCGVATDGRMAVGSSNHTTFLRPMREGIVRVHGRSRHRGRTTWMWELDFQDEAQRLCATSRVVLATFPAPDGPPPLLAAPLRLGSTS